MIPVDDLLLSPHLSIREAMRCLDRNARGVALVVDQQQRLMATVTDGDIRRALLAGLSLETPVHTLIEQEHPERHARPLTATVDTPEAELFRLMSQHTLRHIPIVDDTGRVVRVALLSNLIKRYELPLTAVVMAGGYGTRLRPLTETLPKPMLPVGNRPLLELIIDQLSRSGIRRVHLTTHYKADVITQHFGDGREFGIEIHYVQEEQPLGTAGALSLLNANDEPLLVMNGDILTRLDFRALLAFHRDQEADMTVAVRQFEVCLPYGVIETEGHAIVGVTEKPVVQHVVNAGIYLLNPDVCRLIPTGQPYDMTDLISCLLAMRRRVVSFPICEYWQDIGQLEDYQKAVTAVTAGEIF